MRFQFKTSYNQDIRLFRDKVDAGWYAVLAVIVLALPFLMDDYYVGESTWVFIYGICGVSLMVLVGYTGLVSNGIGNLLWFFGCSRVGVPVASLFQNLMPIAAVLVSLLFGREPTWAQIVGGAIILAGVLYAQLAGRRRSQSAARHPTFDTVADRQPPLPSTRGRS